MHGDLGQGAEDLAQDTVIAAIGGLVGFDRSRALEPWVDRIADTWLFNAGNQIGEVPARVEIDLKQQAARWISLAGVEEQALQ